MYMPTSLLLIHYGGQSRAEVSSVRHLLSGTCRYCVNAPAHTVSKGAWELQLYEASKVSGAVGSGGCSTAWRHNDGAIKVLFYKGMECWCWYVECYTTCIGLCVRGWWSGCRADALPTQCASCELLIYYIPHPVEAASDGMCLGNSLGLHLCTVVSVCVTWHMLMWERNQAC